MYTQSSYSLLEPTTWNKALILYLNLKYQSAKLLKEIYPKEILKQKSKILKKLLIEIKKDEYLFKALEKEEEKREGLRKGKQILKIETTRNNLINCGNKNIFHKLYCKKCKDQGKESLLLEEKQEKVSCTIGYCQNPNCVKTRYAITSKRLYNTFFKFRTKEGKPFWKQIKGDDLVMHCSISPLPIYIKDIKKTKKLLLSQINHLISVLNKGSQCPIDHRSYLKEITNTFIDAKGKEHKTSYKLRFYKKLTKRGWKEILVFKPLQLRGIKAFDIIYHHVESKIRPHYHLAIIPNKKKDFIPIALIQYIRKQIFERSTNKLQTQMNFHLGDKKNRESNFGYKPAKSVLTYMTKRTIGAFGKSDKYRPEDLENKKIETIFEDKGIYGYKDFLSVENYVKYFHNQKTISYFGKDIKRKYTCNDMTFIENHLPLKCAFCGELNQDEIEYLRSEELIKPPPDPQLILSKFEGDGDIEKIKKQLEELKIAKEDRKIKGYSEDYPMAKIPSVEEVDELNDLINYKPIERAPWIDNIKLLKKYWNKKLISGITNKEFEEIKMKKRRLFNFKINRKIKLTASDYIDIAIFGKC